MFIFIEVSYDTSGSTLYLRTTYTCEYAYLSYEGTVLSYKFIMSTGTLNKYSGKLHACMYFRKYFRTSVP